MNAVSRLRDSAIVNYGLVAAAVVAFCARAVPFDNEYVYLLRLKRTYDPDFLLNDISFATPAPEHWLFNHLFGLLTYLTSLEAIAWGGRIMCWAVLIWAIQRFARYWEIPLWMSTGGILLWLASGQSVAGGEWVIGTFEAKCVAYICLFLALEGLLRQRTFYPAALLGLTFAFHPAVGMWSILAAGVALLFAGTTTTEIFRIAAVTALFALPGLLPLLGTSTPATAEDWRYLELVRFPQIFDPLSWSKTLIVVLYVQLGFCLLVYLKTRRNRGDKFMIAFLGALAAFFTFGMLLRATGQFRLMELMPTRLFPVLILLCFWWYLGRAFVEGLFTPPVNALALTAVFALVLLPSPLAAGSEQISRTIESWRGGRDTIEDAFAWVGSNTPNGTVVIAPPWRQDLWWQAKRAQVVSWNFPTYADLGEWRRRVESLAGDTPRTRDGDTRTDFYYSLGSERIDQIAAQTAAGYLISNTEYPYPVIYRSGETRVYKLR